MSQKDKCEAYIWRIQSIVVTSVVMSAVVMNVSVGGVVGGWRVVGVHVNRGGDVMGVHMRRVVGVHVNRREM